MIPLNPLLAPPARRWLLVDDNLEILSLMQETVAQLFGVEAAAHHSPCEALAAFQAAPEEFQIIITDLEMPVMDGFELCHRLLAIAPAAKVFLATGSHFVTRGEARARGFCGLLTKPFSPLTLQHEIAAVRFLTGHPAAMAEAAVQAWTN